MTAIPGVPRGRQRQQRQRQQPTTQFSPIRPGSGSTHLTLQGTSYSYEYSSLFDVYLMLNVFIRGVQILTLRMDISSLVPHTSHVAIMAHKHPPYIRIPHTPSNPNLRSCRVADAWPAPVTQHSNNQALNGHKPHFHHTTFMYVLVQVFALYMENMTVGFPLALARMGGHFLCIFCSDLSILLNIHMYLGTKDYTHTHTQGTTHTWRRKHTQGRTHTTQHTQNKLGRKLELSM